MFVFFIWKNFFSVPPNRPVRRSCINICYAICWRLYIGFFLLFVGRGDFIHNIERRNLPIYSLFDMLIRCRYDFFRPSLAYFSQYLLCLLHLNIITNYSVYFEDSLQLFIKFSYWKCWTHSIRFSCERNLA